MFELSGDDEIINRAEAEEAAKDMTTAMHMRVIFNIAGEMPGPAKDNALMRAISAFATHCYDKGAADRAAAEREARYEVTERMREDRMEVTKTMKDQS